MSVWFASAYAIILYKQKYIANPQKDGIEM